MWREGTDSRWLGDVADEAFRGSWEVKPDEPTLWRWLERAVAEGKVLRKGTGRRNGPFRYWLPEAEARWKRSSFYLEDLPDLDELDGLGDDEPGLPPGLRAKEGKEK